MPEAVLEKEIVEKLRRSDAIEALEEKFVQGVRAAKRIGRTTTDAAEDLLEDTNRQIRRHPTGSVLGAMAVGLLIGGLAGMLIRRR